MLQVFEITRSAEEPARRPPGGMSRMSGHTMMRPRACLPALGGIDNIESMDRDYTSYFEGWRKRSIEAERLRQEREDRAKDLLPLLVERLTTKHGASRIILVGSLASVDFLTHSDIDLVVEDLGPGRELFVALAELQDIAGSIRVDIIPWEDAIDEVRLIAEREGEVLFDDRPGIRPPVLSKSSANGLWKCALVHTTHSPCVYTRAR